MPMISERAARQTPDASIAVASAIADALQAAGTEIMFGVPGGGANLDVVGACQRAGLRFVLTHTETAGALMAAAYGELTGRPGACLATRGPGATSVVNGVAQAWLDRAPLVVITDAVSESAGVRVSRQRIDQRAVFAPVVKHSIAIGVDEAAHAADAAVRATVTGRPGPVHMDVDVEASADVVVSEPETRSGNWAAARGLLASSVRPVFLVGLGARNSADRLRGVIDGSSWRVLTTYKAKGIVPESWPNSAGLFTGARIESSAVEDADLIIAVGLDPVELIPAPWPYRAPVLSLTPWNRDADYYVPDVELVGPLDELLEMIGATLPRRSGPADGERFRVAASAAIAAPDGRLGPQAVALAARRYAPARAVATVDAGAHMLVVMPYWSAEAMGDVLISSGHATMGFALPAAIAASLVYTDRRVTCFVGDGGLGMVLAELETVARLQLPITIVVFNDSALSLIEIKRDQERHGGSDSLRYCDSDFAAIARGFGLEARSPTSLAALEADLEDAFRARGPMLLDVPVDPVDYGRVMAQIRG
jgi:acetolactate synthase I/II/III large subunit